MELEHEEEISERSGSVDDSKSAPNVLLLGSPANDSNIAREDGNNKSTHVFLSGSTNNSSIHNNSQHRPSATTAPSSGINIISGSGGGHCHPNSLKSSSRKMRRHNRKLSKRVRRVTQPPAPKNNNEFLMNEHDSWSLLNLDNDHDQLGTEGEDSNSDEKHHNNNNTLSHLHHHSHHHPQQPLILPYSSSPEDEDEFLEKDFINAYTGASADRLYSLTKSQLILEYQLLQERVEFLEQKIRNSDRAGVDMDGNLGMVVSSQ